MKHVLLIGGAMMLAVLTSFANAAEVDYFIKIPGVDGEARDARHDKWIIIAALDWGGYHLDREAGAVRFGDGVSGRRPASGNTNSSETYDPDRPVIVGRVPNSDATAQQNQTDLAFVISRASKATPKLMHYCANGKHLAKVEIDQLGNGERVARYVLHEPRFTSFVAGDVRLSAGAARAQSLNNLKQMALAARSLETDPKISLVYQCAEWTNYQTGEKGGNCVASKASKDIRLKGSKILEN